MIRQSVRLSEKVAQHRTVSLPPSVLVDAVGKLFAWQEEAILDG